MPLTAAEEPRSEERPAEDPASLARHAANSVPVTASRPPHARNSQSRGADVHSELLQHGVGLLNRASELRVQHTCQKRSASEI